MTPDTLRLAVPFSSSRADTFAVPLTTAMDEFGIDTPKRQAAFLGQIAVESGSFRYTLELASGDTYEGRADLGNTVVGDGRRFKGRGLIQITGRANYLKCGQALGMDLIQHPEFLEEPGPACRSACWYWAAHNLNRFADIDAFGSLTKAINGGYVGLDDRIQNWLSARRALEVV